MLVAEVRYRAAGHIDAAGHSMCRTHDRSLVVVQGIDCGEGTTRCPTRSPNHGRWKHTEICILDLLLYITLLLALPLRTLQCMYPHLPSLNISYCSCIAHNTHTSTHTSTHLQSKCRPACARAACVSLQTCCIQRDRFLFQSHCCMFDITGMRLV